VMGRWPGSVTHLFAGCRADKMFGFRSEVFSLL
jgi:hypothetical protein